MNPFGRSTPVTLPFLPFLFIFITRTLYLPSTIGTNHKAPTWASVVVVLAVFSRHHPKCRVVDPVGVVAGRVRHLGFLYSVSIFISSSFVMPDQGISS